MNRKEEKCSMENEREKNKALFWQVTGKYWIDFLLYIWLSFMIEKKVRVERWLFWNKLILNLIGLMIPTEPFTNKEQLESGLMTTKISASNTWNEAMAVPLICRLHLSTQWFREPSSFYLVVLHCCHTSVGPCHLLP